MDKVSSFPKTTIKFLSDLSKHNSKEWFEMNRERFDSEFLQPAVQFVIDLGDKLSVLSPGIFAIPKIDKSIFRLHRDVRFSKDKSPYKTNLGLYFWEGAGKKMECSGYYFHLESKSFFLGAGMYMFTKDQLKKYREVVAVPEKGKELTAIIKKITSKEKYKIGGMSFKKVPKGFDLDYKYNDLLLHNGLYLFYESNDLTELSKNDPVKFSLSVFKELSPIHSWLLKNVIN